MKKIVYVFLLLAAAAGMSIYQPACSRTAKVTIEDSTVQSAASGKLSPSQAQELAAR